MKIEQNRENALTFVTLKDELSVNTLGCAIGAAWVFDYAQIS
jgi:hypothetical protein